MSTKQKIDKLMEQYNEANSKLSGLAGEARRKQQVIINALDKEIGRLRSIIVNAGGELPVGERHTSILSQESCYRGKTTHGYSIGEGCYWNRGGHR